MPKPPPALNTGNTVRCDVSFISSVVEKLQPFSIAPGISAAVTGLAAQHAVLVGDGQPHHLDIVGRDALQHLGGVASPGPGCEDRVVDEAHPPALRACGNAAIKSLALGEIVRIAAGGAGPEVADGETRIELEPGRDGRLGFLELAEFAPDAAAR